MKKYFMIGLGIVLALSLTIILYGAWLNERGEFQQRHGGCRGVVGWAHHFLSCAEGQFCP